MRYLLFVFAICAAAVFAQAPAPPSFKNLQVLKPADIRVAMRNAATGLGVQCTECHTSDFSVDEKQDKLIARKMFAMTEEINTKFPDGKAHVTCYTCHRGQKQPLMAAPAAQ